MLLQKANVTSACLCEWARKAEASVRRHCVPVQGLGDLAAHLVAFHNMGASPAHDDPFTSDVKVDFNGDDDQGSEGDNSPQAHSQQHNAAGPSYMEDRAFERPAQVRVFPAISVCKP